MALPIFRTRLLHEVKDLPKARGIGMVYTRTAARVLAKNVLHHLRCLQAKNAFLSIFPIRRISASAKVGVLSLFIFHLTCLSWDPISGQNPVRRKKSVDLKKKLFKHTLTCHSPDFDLLAINLRNTFIQDLWYCKKVYIECTHTEKRGEGSKIIPKT